MKTHPTLAPSVLPTFALAVASSLAAAAALHAAPPYDLSALDALLDAEARSLQGHYAIIVRQNGTELYRRQLGDIGFDTKLGIASLTKTLSAAVVLRSAEAGEIALDETLGELVPLMESEGLGAPSVIDAFGMRHGIRTRAPYELLPLTLGQSVLAIATNGTQAFVPGTALEYEGTGMQVVGFACETRAGTPWASLAANRVLGPCGMPQTDYGQFAPNPAIAGGARSTATEIDRFGSMIIAGGVIDGITVLSPESIERLFTNATKGLPVVAAPFPPSHPLYRYGQDPDYGFGAWVVADHPVTGEVEELLGAGAWGSNLWLDRRRGISATFITDVPGFSEHAIDAALGMHAILREETEGHQARSLDIVSIGGQDALEWIVPAGATSTRVYASDEPIRDIADLRAATLLADTAISAALVVPPFGTTHYAVLSVFDGFENTALVPGSNSRQGPGHCAEDIDGNGFVGPADLVLLLGAWSTPGPGDLDANGTVDASDLSQLLAAWGLCG